MRPRGLSRSSPSTWYVGQVAVQKPQCTHLRRMASASRPSGVSRMKSASSVCMPRYTFLPMKLFFWLIVLATIGGIVYFFARWRRQWAERQQEADARMMSLIVQARPPAPAGAATMAPAPAAPQERLLLDAAAQAGEAG